MVSKTKDMILWSTCNNNACIHQYLRVQRTYVSIRRRSSVKALFFFLSFSTISCMNAFKLQELFICTHNQGRLTNQPVCLFFSRYLVSRKDLEDFILASGFGHFRLVERRLLDAHFDYIKDQQTVSILKTIVVFLLLLHDIKETF